MRVYYAQDAHKNENPFALNGNTEKATAAEAAAAVAEAAVAEAAGAAEKRQQRQQQLHHKSDDCLCCSCSFPLAQLPLSPASSLLLLSTLPLLHSPSLSYSFSHPLYLFPALLLCHFFPLSFLLSPLFSSSPPHHSLSLSLPLPLFILFRAKLLISSSKLIKFAALCGLSSVGQLPSTTFLNHFKSH